jgi:thiol-disulfide isomerase/thioredoxin
MRAPSFLARTLLLAALVTSAAAQMACADNSGSGAAATSDTGDSGIADFADNKPAGKERVKPVPQVDGSPGHGVAPADQVWAEAPSYDLYAGKSEDAAARFFQSPDFQSLLVLPGSGEQAFVIALKAKKVSVVGRNTVTAMPDGAVLTSEAQSTMKPAGAATQNGADLSFKAGAAEYRLTPEPAMIGPTTREAILKKKGDYAAQVQLYKPKSAAVSLIKSVTQSVEIKVFFGTWCSYCKIHLPRFIKTLDTAGNGRIHVEYFGLDEGMSEPEAEITKYAVSKTPTFVVLVNGKEAGRIVEEPKASMEEDLALILMGR